MKYLLALVVGFSFLLSAEALRFDPRQMTNTGEFVPQNCAVWNDGCNDCEKTESGYECPPRICANDRMGYCRVEKVSSDPVISPPTKPRRVPRPSNCNRWFDGCNTCVSQGNGVSTTCTMMACETYDEPRCLDESNPVMKPLPDPIIPENCTSWFDGCNGCAVENGQLTYCTERACNPDQLKPGYCTAFKKETLPPADDKSEILEVTIGPEMVDCSAFRRTCMVMNGAPFPSWIDGFDFEPGFNYELRIKKTKRAQPLLDVGAYQYNLIEELSKIPVGSTRPEPFPPIIPENCLSWFDGCNTCGVRDGALTFCTEMACVGTPAEPYCRTFEDEPQENEPLVIPVPPTPVVVPSVSPDWKPDTPPRPPLEKYPLVEPYHPNFWGFVKYHFFGLFR
jgi:hypothetical protein